MYALKLIKRELLECSECNNQNYKTSILNVCAVSHVSKISNHFTKKINT